MRFLKPLTMEHSRLNLRWNNHTITFVNKLDQFRLEKLYCDATIACDGMVYPVHKVVLSACSDFFASIFASTKCQNPVIILQDVDKIQLESLLIYMYRGEVRVLQEDLSIFIKVAESLHVKGLAVPIPENYPEQQAEKSCHSSHYVPLNESQFTDSSLPTAIPKPQQGSYTHKATAPSTQSQRIMQPFPQEEIPVFQAGRSGEMSLKRKSQEREETQYSRQNGNDFQRLHIAEHVHPLRLSEKPVKIKPKMDNVQQGKKDDNQSSHAREAGPPVRSRSEGDQSARVSRNEFSPVRPASADKVFRTSLDSELHEMSNVSNDTEIKTDPTRDNSIRSDSIRDSVKSLCNGNSSGHNTSSEPQSRLKAAAEPPLKKTTSSSKGDSAEYHSLQGKSFLVSSANGTFQNLVSEENPIKNEPDDCPMDDYESASLSISEDFDDVKDDESDSFSLKIAEDASHYEETSSSENHPDTLQKVPDPSDPSPEKAAPGTETPGMPASQLRRELLRPIHHKTSLVLPPKPQSIPHPVISPREPERFLREPPPLMKIDPKIPLLIKDIENERSQRGGGRKEVQENSHSSHLLVKAPPTYHSQSSPPTYHSQTSPPTYNSQTSPPIYHLQSPPPTYHIQSSPPTHFSLHIHNQHLGSVVVNGGAPISEIPSNSHNSLFMPMNEGPLNLSGQKNSPEITDEKDDSGDPFLGKIITNRKKRLRGPKSWEFLVRLLKDPTTNPFLIRWENEETGVFRLVQPAAIAQRWGRRTGKHASECLSYENFARGLRYHYATGALQPVSERSFVYRFGPKALKALQQCDSAAFPYL